MRRMLSVLLVLMTGWSATAGYRAAPAKPGPFPDVAAGHWAAGSIRRVAVEHDWLRDFGPSEFRPSAPLARRHLARAIVLAFASPAQSPPARFFKDLPQTDPSHPFAARAVALGWMGTTRAGEFLPDGTVTKTDLAQVLALALGLRRELAGLDAIATADGRRLVHPRHFPALTLAGTLRLFRNHSDESRELLPSTRVLREDAAYALAVAAAAAGTWRIRSLAPFRTITFPETTSQRRGVIEFALAHVGFPYVKAGEWPSKTPKVYCCGAQVQGGFDCSGFVWWVLRRAGGGYDPGRARPYPGWALAERSSASMARAASPRLPVAGLRAGDLLFSDTDGRGSEWAAIDHVGIALGGGWMIHASSPGVLLDVVGTGWWSSRVRFGRSVVEQPEETTPPSPSPEPSPSSTSASPTPSSTPSAHA